MKLQPLEFKLFRLLDKRRGARLLVAVSGGSDSVSLLLLLKKIQFRLDFSLTVAHVHHGASTTVEQTRARALAYEFTKNLSKEHKLPFISNFGSQLVPDGESEASLRKFRHEHLERMRIKCDADFVVFAHHSDDLFETRLIRLLRGTGAQGIKAMKVRNGVKLRPLLGVSRESLRTYLAASGVSAIQDPSNQSPGPLRNWLRQVWLKDLEVKRPGSTKSLARSMSLLAESISFSQSASRSLTLEKVLKSGVIDRRIFDGLSRREKRLVLSVYLRKRNAQNISRSQIEEVVKRLDTDQKSLMFKVGPVNWCINAQQISAD